MKQTDMSLARALTPADVVLNTLRHRLMRYKLIDAVRSFRAFIHFGPWRVLPRMLIRQLRPVVIEANPSPTSVLENVDVDSLVNEIRKNSVAVAGVLSDGFVRKMRSVTDHLPSDHYQLMHYVDDNVRQLAEDPIVKAVLRKYFKCEPVLLESTIVAISSDKVNGEDDQNLYHFDYAGWESLNVFVYLTDVGMNSSYHVIAKGSHDKIRFKDALRSHISDEEAEARFGNAISPILGSAGTLFFENTEAYHKRFPGDERRVLLNLLFASHRGFLSHGRTNEDEIKMRTRAYERFRVS